MGSKYLAPCRDALRGGHCGDEGGDARSGTFGFFSAGTHNTSCHTSPIVEPPHNTKSMSEQSIGEIGFYVICTNPDESFLLRPRLWFRMDTHFVVAPLVFSVAVAPNREYCRLPLSSTSIESRASAWASARGKPLSFDTVICRIVFCSCPYAITRVCRRQTTRKRACS